MERPILFSGLMVRAILGARKIQTRRVVKLDCEYSSPPVCMDNETPHYWAFGADHYTCPYGASGDLLWVRETWASGEDAQNEPRGPVYRATDPGWDDNKTGLKWRPSIFMPRWASRLTLEITDVRVQRLRDISDEDAAREGCQADETGFVKEHFADLWDSINKKRGFGWDKNPWVWAITFEVV